MTPFWFQQLSHFFHNIYTVWCDVLIHMYIVQWSNEAINICITINIMLPTGMSTTKILCLFCHLSEHEKQISCFQFPRSLDEELTIIWELYFENKFCRNKQTLSNVVSHLLVGTDMFPYCLVFLHTPPLFLCQGRLLTVQSSSFSLPSMEYGWYTHLLTSQLLNLVKRNTFHKFYTNEYLLNICFSYPL